MNTTKLITITASLFLSSASSWAQLKVTTGNNVGIGVTAPGAKFHVLGNSLFTSATTGYSSAALIRGNQTYSEATTANSKGPDYTWYGDDATGIFHPAAWQIGFAVGGSEKMRLNWDGCLYLNTLTNPDYEMLSIKNRAGGWPVMTNTHVSSGTFNYAQRFYVDNSSTRALAVINGGADKFYVYGSGSVQAAVGYYTFSDATLKENVQPVPDALEKVLKLRGVTYFYKKTGDDKSGEAQAKQLGLIAQEVEKIIPEVVSTNEKGIKSITYGNLVALLIESTKEQNKLVSDQKEKIAELQQKVESLSSQLNSCCKSGEAISVIAASSLSQNIPNPFTENTEIAYSIGAPVQKAALHIFDMQGTLIRTYDNLKAGTGRLVINGGELKAGMYLYSLIADEKEVDTKRMILTK